VPVIELEAMIAPHNCANGFSYPRHVHSQYGFNKHGIAPDGSLDPSFGLQMQSARVQKKEV
jgi:hypothetical protein